MKSLLKYLNEYKKESILAPLFKMLEASFELLVPLVMAVLIDDGIGGSRYMAFDSYEAYAMNGYGNTSIVLRMGLYLVILGVIGLVCSITAQFFAAKAAVGFSRKLRHAMFSHIQNLSYEKLDQAGTSTLITRMTSDINQVQNGVNMFLRLFLRSPFIVIGAVIMAFYVDAKAALVFAVAIPLLSLVVFAIVFANIPLYRKVQDGLDKVLLSVRENLNGIRVIRAFHKEADEIEAFDKKNQELTRIQLFAGRVSAMLNPVTYVIINIALVFLLKQSALRVEMGSLSQGEVVALVNYMAQILVELVKLANLIVTLTKALACAVRIQTVMELPEGMEEESDINTSSQNEQKIKENNKSDEYVKFDHVGFTYRGGKGEVLTEMDFSVKKGEIVGIIGGTGSGKSTLVQLIPRFYDVTRGKVLVDGKNVKDYEIDTLRKKIGIVPQKAALFKGTIRDNLLFGDPDGTEETLWEALETAQAKEFVEKKEGGLDAEVEQGGRNFSGGQKQRLCIARALVRRPEILILDDSSSALDYATDAALRAALKGLSYRPTVWIVSQRTASIQHADKIVVLDDGEIAGMGTHDELLASCKVYQEIYDSQYQEGGR